MENKSYYTGAEFNNGEEHPTYSDRDFIQGQLDKVPFSVREKLMTKYSNEYERILSDVSVPEHKRVNVARSACNNRLRAAVANYNNLHYPECEIR